MGPEVCVDLRANPSVGSAASLPADGDRHSDCVGMPVRGSTSCRASVSWLTLGAAHPWGMWRHPALMASEIRMTNVQLPVYEWTSTVAPSATPAEAASVGLSQPHGTSVRPPGAGVSRRAELRVRNCRPGTSRRVGSDGGSDDRSPAEIASSWETRSGGATLQRPPGSTPSVTQPRRRGARRWRCARWPVAAGRRRGPARR